MPHVKHCFWNENCRGSFNVNYINNKKLSKVNAIAFFLCEAKLQMTNRNDKKIENKTSTKDTKGLDNNTYRTSHQKSFV